MIRDYLIFIISFIYIFHGSAMIGVLLKYSISLPLSFRKSTCAHFFFLCVLIVCHGVDFDLNL